MKLDFQKFWDGIHATLLDGRASDNTKQAVEDALKLFDMAASLGLHGEQQVSVAEARIQELLESNNALLERARTAEQKLKSEQNLVALLRGEMDTHIDAVGELNATVSA